ALPEALEAAIRRYRMTVAVRQTWAERQLKALGETATALGVPVVLVKGAAAAEAYPEVWMRPYGDIDLLVAEDDATAFLEALKAQGYRYSESAEGHRSWHFPPLIPDHPGCRIEVHTALAREQGRARFTLAAWEGDLRALAPYPGLQTLSPAAHVLYLVHHGVVHHELLMGLQPYLDIGFWSQGWGSAEWEALRTKTEDTAMENAVGLALALMAWVWDRSLPDGAFGFRRPPASLLSEAQAAVAGAAAQRLPHIWRDMPAPAQGGALAYARTILLGDPAQLQALSFGERIKFYLRRPIELLRNHGASLWRLLRGDPATRKAWRAQRELQRWLRE
ncbi:MAG: nucleotidyltransferase family protein, partial [Paracoccaceae bacterium]